MFLKSYCLNPGKLHLFILCLFFFADGFSQKNPGSLSNLRSKKISTKINPLRLDNNSIIPNTILLTGIPHEAYEVDYVNASILWKSTNLPDSVVITYRVFPFKLNSVTRRFNYDSIRFNFSAEKPFVFNANQFQAKVIDFGNINYNGSIGRGITVGNSQNAVVNSTLNLQLSGYIGDSMLLTAAISDNNIPIQPEGNTQNLQDFDKIFMQIKKNGWQANFGDIDIRQTQNYFLNFSKRLQGASFITANKIGDSTKNSLMLTGAITQGEFARNILTALDGNQGPYKLTGNNGEIYFAVLAGTERVYIDGQILTRGEDQDYVINYNTAEVTFTVKHLITKDTRIQVEFEYSNQDYLNSLIYANDEVNINNKLKLSFGAYSSVDAKNSSINQTLSTQQKQYLSQIGNNIDSATYPSAVLDTFAIDKILYIKMDTVYNGIHDSIYVYSTSQTAQLYNLTFTTVGAGKGDYLLVANGNTNGNVYTWIQPINGVKQGDSEPVILLITPKKHQVITTAAQYFFTPKSYIRTEFALSNYDVNTFSTLDKQNDQGVAAKVDYVSQQNVLKNIKPGLVLQTSVDYQYVQANFQPIEVLRNVEFNRDWSIPFDASAATENLVTSSFKLSDHQNNSLKYEFDDYGRSDNYNGIRNSIENLMVLNGWHFSNKFYITTINSSIQQGIYTKPSIDLYKTFSQFGNLKIGGSYSSENDQLLAKSYDTLMPISFAFNLLQLYIKSNEKKKNKWGITYSTREDKIPFQKYLEAGDRSQNVNLTTEILKDESQQLKLNITYRQLNVINEGITNEQADKSLLGRLEYALNKWKGFLKGNILYELGSGQEQKMQYTYLQVPAGQGQYTWIDYNHDGIPELNEFVLAVYQDQKTWIRVYTPTGDYVKANYLQFNYSFSLNPKSLISKNNTNKFAKFIEKFNTTSALQINKKDISTGGFEFNPFSKNIADTSLLSLSSNLTNSIFFNHASSIWGIDITHHISDNKALLSYGVQSTSVRNLSVKGRWSLNHSISTNFTTQFIRNELLTPAYSNENYLINEFSAAPSVSYIHKSNFRLSLIYTYDIRNNQIDSVGEAINNQLAAEVKYNVLSNGTINGSFSIDNISFTGDPASTVGYVLLNGLVPGKNYLWSLELVKKLKGNIELNLQYQGRKPGKNPIVNTGTVSVKALF